MSKATSVTIETTVKAPIDKVWQCWTEPEHIVNWAFASDDWEVPRAENDLREGGRFTTAMAAKDGSEGFDFGGIYTSVKQDELIAYRMDDDRQVQVEFTELPEGVHIRQTFETEQENSVELQRTGWQAILDNFKTYVES